MKKFIKLASSVMVAGVMASPLAIAAEDTTIGSTALIQAPINLTAGDDLNFGTITLPASGDGSSVTLSMKDDGTIDAVSGVSSDSSSTGSFNVDTTDNLTFTLTATSLTDGTNNMTLSALKVYNGSTDVTAGYTPSGVTTLKVGADITLANNQPPGTYNGTVSISVDAS